MTVLGWRLPLSGGLGSSGIGAVPELDPWACGFQDTDLRIDLTNG